ncbi:hypothetical protein BCR37DRAFT_384533 [Protomyces lactucae-debilis]|uniref:Uncharacterized protein n=1 Tax=Protomyces lactucae-debilis TaxID=2754530 RepID=A0A1Y2ERF7_PROLT|nr:uncharacterized protein BCR37DRAFT_384533 [Protomyces lactucae-debilis]ORY74107.1 hypothetical protein BCR37DRAFT_384533 [Protomyces lactucae-debilis]
MSMSSRGTQALRTGSLALRPYSQTLITESNGRRQIILVVVLIFGLLESWVDHDNCNVLTDPRNLLITQRFVCYEPMALQWVCNDSAMSLHTQITQFT